MTNTEIALLVIIVVLLVLWLLRGNGARFLGDTTIFFVDSDCDHHHCDHSDSCDTD